MCNSSLQYRVLAPIANYLHIRPDFVHGTPYAESCQLRETVEQDPQQARHPRDTQTFVEETLLMCSASNFKK